MGIIVGTVVLTALFFLVASLLRRPSGTGPTHICANCHTAVRPTNDRPGSFGMECVLWLCFLVPGFIYSMWRLCAQRVVACPACKANNPIPLNSPAGRALAGSLIVNALIPLPDK